jgi:hypothetical protein
MSTFADKLDAIADAVNRLASDCKSIEDRMDAVGGWSKEEAERVLRERGHVTAIGQLSSQAARHLENMVKNGLASKDIDYGYPIAKKMYRTR